jgi:protein-tyrosine phosphatase
MSPMPFSFSLLFIRWRRTMAVNYGTGRGWVRHVLAVLGDLAGRYEMWAPALPKQRRRMVFVCLGNINRSAFGAEVARNLGMEAVSIGLSTTTGAPATPMAQVQALRQQTDLSMHRATDLRDYRPEPGDLLLVMEVRHARQLQARGIAPESIALLGHWSRPRRLHLHDPHTLSSDYFATCFTLIESAVRNLAAGLVEGTHDRSPP